MEYLVTLEIFPTIFHYYHQSDEKLQESGQSGNTKYSDKILTSIITYLIDMRLLEIANKNYMLSIIRYSFVKLSRLPTDAIASSKWIVLLYFLRNFLGQKYWTIGNERKKTLLKLQCCTIVSLSRSRSQLIALLDDLINFLLHQWLQGMLVPTSNKQKPDILFSKCFSFKNLFVLFLEIILPWKWFWTILWNSIM